MPMPMMRIPANNDSVAAAAAAAAAVDTDEVAAADVAVADQVAIDVVAGVHFAIPNYHRPIIPCPKVHCIKLVP